MGGVPSRRSDAGSAEQPDRRFNSMRGEGTPPTFTQFLRVLESVLQRKPTSRSQTGPTSQETRGEFRALDQARQHAEFSVAVEVIADDAESVEIRQAGG